MVIDELVVKIVSKLDDSGFEKLDELQEKAQKSSEKLSFTIKDFFKGIAINSFFSMFKTSLNDVSKFLEDETPADTFAPKNLQKSGQNSTEFKPKRGTSKDENIFQKMLSFFKSSKENSSKTPSVLRVQGIEKIFEKNTIDKLSDTKPDNTKRFQSPSNNLNATSTRLSFSGYLNELPKGKEIFSAPNLQDKASIGAKSSDIFTKEALESIKRIFYVPENRGLFSAMTISDSFKGLDTLTPERLSAVTTPQDSRQISTTTNSAENTSMQNNFTLNVSSGAVQINSSDSNPQEIGDSVKTALSEVFDDFILKRGYTNSGNR